MRNIRQAIRNDWDSPYSLTYSILVYSVGLIVTMALVGGFATLVLALTGRLS